MKVKRRQDQFENSILDLTTGLANALRAGMALPQALEKVGAQMTGAVSDGDYSALKRAAVHALAECFSAEVDEAYLSKIENLTRDLANSVRRDRARIELEALSG